MAAVTKPGAVLTPEQKEKALAYGRAYYHSHKEQRAAYRRAHPEQHRLYGITKHERHREKRLAYMAEYGRSHPAERRQRNAERRAAAASVVWTRMNPWPGECSICGEPLDQSLHYPDGMSETIGHEPPIAWLVKHPEYDGEAVIRPEHLSCNKSKFTRPDWALR